MSFGLQVFSPSGAVVLDITDRVTQYYGQYTVNIRKGTLSPFPAQQYPTWVPVAGMTPARWFVNRHEPDPVYGSLDCRVDEGGFWAITKDYVNSGVAYVSATFSVYKT